MSWETLSQFLEDNSALIRKEYAKLRVSGNGTPEVTESDLQRFSMTNVNAYVALRYGA
jgi:hypothetical protein